MDKKPQQQAPQQRPADETAKKGKAPKSSITRRTRQPLLSGN